MARDEEFFDFDEVRNQVERSWVLYAGGIVLFVCSLGMFLATTTQLVMEKDTSPSHVYAMVDHAAVVIYVSTGRGSGTAITGLGKDKSKVYVLTAGHVPDKLGDRVGLQHRGKKKEEWDSGKVVFLSFNDQDLDVAVIEPERPSDYRPIVFRPYVGCPPLGTEVFLSGLVDGHGFGFTKGYYRGRGDVAYGPGFGEYMFTSCDVQPGASGSGVYVNKGGTPYLLGLLTRGNMSCLNRWVLPVDELVRALNPLGL